MVHVCEWEYSGECKHFLDDFYDCQFIWGKSDKDLIQFHFQKFITVHFNVETNFTMFVFVSVRLVSHCQGQSRKISI